MRSGRKNLDVVLRVVFHMVRPNPGDRGVRHHHTSPAPPIVIVCTRAKKTGDEGAVKRIVVRLAGGCIIQREQGKLRYGGRGVACVRFAFPAGCKMRNTADGTFDRSPQEDSLWSLLQMYRAACTHSRT